MRLDVALVHGLGAELALDHDVGLAERRVHVAQLELGVVRDVAGVLGVELRGTLGHRLLGAGDGREHLELDVDKRERCLGRVRVGGGNTGYRVALVHDLVGGEDLVAEMAVADVPAARVRQVLRRDDRPDVGMGLGPAGVYGLDCCVRMGAPQDRAVDQPGQDYVCAVLGLAGDLFVAVVPDRPLAYGLVLGVGEDNVRRHLRGWTSLVFVLAPGL